MVDLPWAGILVGVPRTIWKGALSFGLVNIPVGLYPATSDKSIHFNQFEEGTSDRIRYKKVNERTGEEVPQDRIVKGYDLGGGEYVILTEEELESAEPKKSRQIEISDFVGLVDIDPVFFRSSYYLAPRGQVPTRPTPCSAERWPKRGVSLSPRWSCGTRSIWSPSGPRTMRWRSTPCTSRTRCAIPTANSSCPRRAT